MCIDPYLESAIPSLLPLKEHVVDEESFGFAGMTK